MANKIHLYLEKPDIQQHPHAISTQEMRINIHTEKEKEQARKSFQTIVVYLLFFPFSFCVPCTFVRIVPHIAFLFSAPYIPWHLVFLPFLLFLFSDLVQNKVVFAYFWSYCCLLFIFTWIFAWHCSFPFRMHKFSPLKSGYRTTKKRSMKQKLLALYLQMFSIANGANFKWNILCIVVVVLIVGKRVCVCVAIAQPGSTWLGLAQLDLDYFFPLLHFLSFIRFLLHI